MSVRVHFRRDREGLREGESLPGQLALLNALNFYDPPTLVQRVLIQGTGARTIWEAGRPTKSAILERLSDLTDINALDLYRASAHRFAPLFTLSGQSPTTMDVMGVTVPLVPRNQGWPYILPDHIAQYCPQCMRKAPYHRVLWLPVATAVCATCRCVLHDRCHHCGRAVSIRHVTTGQCKWCGSNLGEAPVVSIEGDVEGFMAQATIQAWLMGSTTPTSSLHLPNQSPRILFRLLEGLCRAIITHPPTWPHRYQSLTADINQGALPPISGRLCPAQRYINYTTAFKGLMNWPLGFYSFLDNHRSHTVTDGDARFSKEFGSLYTNWIGRLWEHPDYAFVQDAFDRYLADKFGTTENLYRLGRYKQRPFLAQQCPYVGMQAVADELGVGIDLVSSLVKVAVVAAVRGPSIDGSDQYLFARGAGREFLSAIAANVTVDCARSHTWITLQVASTMLAVVDLDAANLLHVVMEGKAHGYCEKITLTSVRDLWFCKEEIGLLRTTICEENNWIGSRDVIRILRTSAKTLHRWMKTGLLNPCARAAGAIYFAHSDVMEFRETYIMLDEAAVILGVKPNSVSSFVQRRGVADAWVSGPAINGSYVLLFHRAELLRWRTEHVTTDEAADLIGICQGTLYQWIRQGRIVPLLHLGRGRFWFARSQLVGLRPYASDAPNKHMPGPAVFVRSLTDEERQTIETGLVSTLTFVRHRCVILLASAEHQRVGQIASVVGCSTPKVYNTIHAFNTQGLSSLTPPKTGPRMSSARAFSDDAARTLCALLRRSPKEFGHATDIWTYEIAAEVSFTQGLTRRITSDMAVRSALKRIGVSWAEAKSWLE